MNTRIQTQKKVKADVGYETSKFTYGVGLTVAALIGLWGAACMISGLAQVGLVDLIKGFLTAVTGV